MNGADMEALAIIAGWLRTLAAVTRHPGGGPDGDALAAYATLLVRDFPAAAFTAESLHHVARAFSWWPPYADLRGRLAEWWQQQAPPMLEGDALPVMDRLWLSYADRRRAEGADPGRVLAQVRAYAPAAWERLTARGDVARIGNG